ncbi:hypothetical protein ACFLUB_03750 [Chloroflexota bacterium]
MIRDEHGFSLIILAVAVAISAVIAAGAGMTTVQVINGTQRNNDHATAIRQAQNLGSWFSRDALMAQTINATDDSGTADDEFVIIYWKDWESGDTHDIRYVWLDGADSLKYLQRKQITRDKNSIETGNTTTLVAGNVYSANLTQQTNTWCLSVETRSGQKSLIREYKIGQRLAQ